MALTATTLAAAKALNDVRIKLTSATGVAAKQLALVDGGEWMRITDVSLSPTVGVVPGYAGSAATPHGILGSVVFGPTGDFVASGITPGTIIASQSFGVSGAITGPSGAGTVPVTNTLIYITKATAAAMTLAAPAADQTNVLTIITTTAAAHTITYTAGFYGNTTSSDVATAAATANSVLVLKARDGTWSIQSNTNFTVA